MASKTDSRPASIADVPTFTTTLSEVTTAAVTIDLNFTGTAAASDYNASGHQIVIAPGATTGSISVTAIDDNEDESELRSHLPVTFHA